MGDRFDLRGETSNHVLVYENYPTGSPVHVADLHRNPTDGTWDTRLRVNWREEGQPVSFPPTSSPEEALAAINRWGGDV